jgi:hypothetical protein
MWTSVSRDDLGKAKANVEQRRIDMEARHAEEIQNIKIRHAEELEVLQAKATKLANVERAIDEFFREFINDDPDNEKEQSSGEDGEPDKTELVTYLKPPSEPKAGAMNWGDARVTIGSHTDYSEP